MGGAQSKDTDELLTRMIAKEAGIRITYIPFKSGGEAAVQLAGGHINSHTNNPSESIGQWKGGTQRPICVFNPQRLPAGPKVTATEGWHDIPTCVEQGLNIPQFQQPRTVWLPGRVTPDQVAFYVDLMKKVQAAPEWKEYIERTSQTDTFLTGAASRSSSTRTSSAFARSRPRKAGSSPTDGASMISRRGLETGTAALTGAFGLAVAVSSVENGIGWSSAGVESGTFPFVTGLIILAASGYNLATAGLLRGSRARVIGWGDLKKLAALFLPAVIFVAAIPLLGMHVASAIYIFAVLVPQHHVSVARAIVIAGVTAVSLYVMFDWAFQVTLPRGLLGAALGF